MKKVLFITACLIPLTSYAEDNTKNLKELFSSTPCAALIETRQVNNAMFIWARHANSTKWARFAINSGAKGNQQQDYIRACRSEPESSALDVMQYLMDGDEDRFVEFGDWKVREEDGRAQDATTTNVKSDIFTKAKLSHIDTGISLYSNTSCMKANVKASYNTKVLVNGREVSGSLRCYSGSLELDVGGNLHKIDRMWEKDWVNSQFSKLNAISVQSNGLKAIVSANGFSKTLTYIKEKR